MNTGKSSSVQQYIFNWLFLSIPNCINKSTNWWYNPKFTQQLIQYDNRCDKSGDEEGIPDGDSGDSTGWSEPNSSGELLDSEDDWVGGDNWCFWSLPSVNESSCKIEEKFKMMQLIFSINFPHKINWWITNSC